MEHFCVVLLNGGQAISEKTLFEDFYNVLRQLQSVFTKSEIKTSNLIV